MRRHSLGHRRSRTSVAAQTTTVIAPQVVSGYAKTFQALDVIGATSQSDPLEDEFTVRANQFKRKANLEDHPDDPRKFKKNDTCVKMIM